MTSLQLAIQHIEELSAKGNWTSLTRDYDGSISVEYGTIHTDGSRERAIATISYIDKNGLIDFVKKVHL